MTEVHSLLTHLIFYQKQVQLRNPSGPIYLVNLINNHLIWLIVSNTSKFQTINQLKIDINAFKSTLLTKNCIIVGMTIYNSIFESKGGIYQTPKTNDQIIGGHGVCIVGFDDVKKLFKFRNSWGVSWGDRGYGYIKYEDINKLITDAYIITL